MGRNAFVLKSRWVVQGSVQEVYDIVSDADALANWWPAGFLDVEIEHQGDETGVGKTLLVLTKGWLPYTIRWRQRVVQIDPPSGFTIEVWGEFDGRGVWAFQQAGDDVLVDFDWHIRAEKPLLRWGAPIFRRVFAWNHRWVMALGEESLKIEVMRRRAGGAAAGLPLPPGPTWPHRGRRRVEKRDLNTESMPTVAGR